jgi:hypothetical protein
MAARLIENGYRGLAFQSKTKGLGPRLNRREQGPMAITRRSSTEQANYIVLRNTLNEARLQMEALGIAPEARETLLSLLEYCRADYEKRYR